MDHFSSDNDEGPSTINDSTNELLSETRNYVQMRGPALALPQILFMKSHAETLRTQMSYCQKCENW